MIDPSGDADMNTGRPQRRWTGTDYFGASFQALRDMGASKGYTLVYADTRGVNLFFVRSGQSVSQLFIFFFHFCIVVLTYFCTCTKKGTHP